MDKSEIGVHLTGLPPATASQGSAYAHDPATPEPAPEAAITDLADGNEPGQAETAPADLPPTV